MKTKKITQRRHFRKIAAGALMTVMVGTMQVMPVSARPDKRLLGGAGFFASAATAESGSCGENATWTLDTKGRLTISGTGAMTDFSNDQMQPWSKLRSDIKSVEIQGGITSVGTYAFTYCTHLTAADIAKSVTTIGADAFGCCTALTSANIPDGVTTIGFEAFYQCSHISHVDIPSSVTEIKDNAFFGCSNCKDINIDVTDPDKLTWKDNNDDFMPGRQTQCYIPQGTADGYNKAFGDSVNVKFVDNHCGENATWLLDDNGRLTISGTGDMYDFVAGHTGPWETYRDKIKTVVIEDGITSIGERAFYCYHSITSVTIPDSVTSIGKMAFTGNEQLTEINIPAGVTKIDNHTFEGCMALKKITFAKGSKLTAICEAAFYSCESLTEITIPEGVTTIGSYAFSHCAALSSVTIPSTVTKIEDKTFNECKNCKDVYMHVTDPSKLTWTDEGKNSFMPSKATKCHVPGAALSDYQAKFGSSVNVTFVAAD